MRGEDSGPVAARDVTITGGQGPTAGRDAQAITGGPGQTAGRDIITITNVATPPAEVDRPARPTPTGPLSNLPPRNRAFTGRADLLDQLHQQLTTTSVDALAVTALPADLPTTVAAGGDAPRVLHGLGGVGKTHLALEYAHRHPGDYSIRWWVTAEQPAAIPGQLATLAGQLGIPEHADQSETVAALLAELGRRGDWLLVFDNAEDPHDLRPYWPPTEQGGRVLITSRNPNWRPLATPMPLDVLPREDAVAFLQGRAGLDQQDADRLAEVLGDLPLALEQAAAYLEETHTPPGTYLKMLATRTRELLTLGRPATSERTIATIWSVSLQRLHTEAPAAQDLLSLCAFFAPDDIPRSLLEDHPDLLSEPLTAALRDPLAFGRTLGALGRYSLATVTTETVSMHRLVQAVVRDSLSAEHTRTFAAAAVGLVRASFPAKAEDVRVWPTATRLLPHALAAADHASTLRADPNTSAALLHEAGRYLWGRAEHVQAKLLHERALSVRAAQLGTDDLDTAYSHANLGVVLRDLGDLDAARSHLEQVLAIVEARLGADHPETAASLNNLAAVLRAQGDLDRARALHERALAIREARLGADHPDTAQSLNNLATVLHAQGDLDTARTLHERALAIYEARLGTGHPLTATSLNNLALVVRAQGDLDTARTLHERALAIREARLGADHPDTVRSRQNLAAVVAALGEQR